MQKGSPAWHLTHTYRTGPSQVCRFSPVGLFERFPVDKELARYFVNFLAVENH